MRGRNGKKIAEIVGWSRGEEAAKEIARRINDWEYLHDVNHLNQIYTSEIEESVREIEGFVKLVQIEKMKGRKSDLFNKDNFVDQ